MQLIIYNQFYLDNAHDNVQTSTEWKFKWHIYLGTDKIQEEVA